ncbi:MAG: RHS repeat-associated core domain-containing protein [Ignavibacteria bacterium]|nr:RHS repeat-associated core domain-containing protein [Ignavibacteria bacterium]
MLKLFIYFTNPFPFTRKGIFYFNFGTTRAVTDASNTLIASYDFDAWGYKLREWNSGTDAKYRFTGKERDIETSYDYFGARYYDSRIGRWGGVEPKYEKFLSISPYAYSINNSTRYVDSDGRDVGLYLWLPKGNEVGHIGIAVSRYNQDGTKSNSYFYMDLWPNVDVNSDNYKDYVPAKYNEFLIKEDQLRTNFLDGEDEAADGIVIFKN